jgi:hypothetical protein
VTVLSYLHTRYLPKLNPLKLRKEKTFDLTDRKIFLCQENHEAVDFGCLRMKESRVLGGHRREGLQIDRVN